MLALLAAIAALIIGWVLLLGAILWVAALGIVALLRLAAGLLVGFGRFAVRTRPR